MCFTREDAELAVEKIDQILTGTSSNSKPGLMNFGSHSLWSFVLYSFVLDLEKALGLHMHEAVISENGHSKRKVHLQVI